MFSFLFFSLKRYSMLACSEEIWHGYLMADLNLGLWIESPIPQELLNHTRSSRLTAIAEDPSESHLIDAVQGQPRPPHHSLSFYR
jgi:hypothetical protein